MSSTLFKSDGKRLAGLMLIVSLACSCCVLATVEASARQRRRTNAPAPGRQQTSTRGGDSPLVRDAAALLEAGRVEEAEVAARGAVNADPRDAQAHALLGVILEQRGRHDEAERELRESLRLDPKSTGALTNLGVLLVRTNRADEAAKTFEEVLRLAPGHAQAAYDLAALYAARKDYARAIPLLERLAGANDKAAESADLAVLLTLADAYAHAGRAEDAARLSALVERRAGEDPRALFTLGLALADVGAFERAAGLFERTNRLRPNT